MTGMFSDCLQEAIACKAQYNLQTITRGECEGCSGRSDAKAETLVVWPPHAKSWLIGKDSDAGRDWGQEKKGTTEDEMAGWYHWLNGHEFG